MKKEEEKKGKGEEREAEEAYAKKGETKRVGWIPTFPKSLAAANNGGTTRKGKREEKENDSQKMNRKYQQLIESKTNPGPRKYQYWIKSPRTICREMKGRSAT